MLTDRKLLELVYGAASCYIPVEELNQDQLERLDNITYRWCDCERCRRPLKIEDKVLIPQNGGHANRKTLEICLSRQVLKENMNLTPPIFLLTLIAISLHEIVHILFPIFDEGQTVNKTWEWLKQISWVTYAEEFERKAKQQFTQELKEARVLL